MLDKDVQFYDFYMKRPAHAEIPQFNLPDGYRFTTYSDGAMDDWAEIETSVLEFTSVELAKEYFAKEFLPYQEELGATMFFIENKDGKKIATVTAWYAIIDGVKLPLVHWVAIQPDYQGQGLAKPLMSKVLTTIVTQYGAKDCYLHTQTWSHKAVNLYTKFHFAICSEPTILGKNNADASKAKKVLQDLGYTV